MFDWKLYHNEVLIEDYIDINYQNDLFIINDNLTYDNVNDILYRKNDDFEIEIYFQKNYIKVKYSDNYEGEADLVLSNITKDDRQVVITYQIDLEEPINKIIITRKE